MKKLTVTFSISVLLISIFLASFTYATDVSADFGNALTGEGQHFATDLRFTTDFTLSLVSGSVASGDPNNLQSGDAVCTGATIRVAPTVNAKWAVTSLNVVSSYPCSDAYCPAMIPAGAVSTNRNIKWLSTAIFNKHDSWGDDYDLLYDWGDSQTQEYYNDLAPFDVQPVTYMPVPPTTYSGKEGDVKVFCKGSLETRDGATVKGTSSLPSTNNVDFVVNTAGSHSITTRLNSVSCFGAVVKRPRDEGANPGGFRLYYFTENQPSIPSSSAVGTISVNVQNAGGTCAMHQTTVTASGSLSDEDLIMVKVTMQNDGDAIKVTGVSSSNLGYSVSPFPVATCNALGFPPSLCPASNGFSPPAAAINPGNSRNLYVLIDRNGASGGTTLTFNAETASPVCGSTTSCSDDVDLTGAITCDITPASLSVGTLEVAQFTVACQDLAGDPTPCSGSNWYWADGLAGDFISKSNTQAEAYTTSPPGSSGTLKYQSGIALCLSNINVVSPDYECEFLPPGVTMPVSTTQYFQLNCFESSLPSAPDDADYDLINGLSGSTSGSTTSGTDYNAPASADTGDLRGFGEFYSAPPPILGAIAIAPIDVIEAPGCLGLPPDCPDGVPICLVNGTWTCTCDDIVCPDGTIATCPPGGSPPVCVDDNETDNPPGGESQYCTIYGSGLLNTFTGYYSWIPIFCGPQANQPCTNVTWQPALGGTLSGSGNSGTFLNVTGPQGFTGVVSAYVDNDPLHSCYKQFFIGGPPLCIEIS